LSIVTPKPPHLIILIFITLLWVIFIFANPHQQPNFSDFEVYYQAGQKTLSHKTVYDVTGFYQFKYAPVVSLIFGFTINQISFAWSTKLFYFISVIAWICLLIFIAQEVMRAHRPDITNPKKYIHPIVALFFLTLLFYAMGLRDELKLGQINIVPLWLLLTFTLMLPYRTQKLQFITGIILCLAILFKLYSLLFIPLLIFQKRYRLLVNILISFIFFNIFLVAYHGLPFTLTENIAWLTSLFDSSVELLISKYNVSLLATLAKLSNLTLAKAIWGFCLIMFTFMLYRTRKHPPLYHFMLITTIITLLNPISWPYWMIFTLPAFIYITSTLLTPPYFPQKLPLITLLALFYGILAQGQNFDWGRNGGTVIGNLLIAGLFIYLTETRPMQNLNQV